MKSTIAVSALCLLALGVHAHTLRDIAANKIGAFEDRSEVKDAVDLYHLTRRFPWQQLFDHIKAGAKHGARRDHGE